MSVKSRLSIPKAYRRALTLGAFVLAATVATTAVAQNFRNYSCEDLWYARNSIYAEKGYCFKSERARETFGRGCFPPYGRLTRYEKQRVDQIQMWEERKYCN